MKFIELKDYNRAIISFNRASKWLPYDNDIHRKLSIVYLSLAGKMQGYLIDYFLTLSLEHLEKAEQLNPLEPQILISIAQILQLRKNKDPDKIYTAIQRAISLSPNKTIYYTIFANFLYQSDRKNELPQIIKTIARIYPGSYHRMRKKPYWTPSLEEEFKQGLFQAIAQKTDIRKARLALTDILVRHGQWLLAAEQLKLAMTLEKHTNTVRNYLMLGRYYIHGKDIKNANKAFTTAMTMQLPNFKNFNSLLQIYIRTDHIDEFSSFYLQLSRKSGYTYNEDIKMAEVLIQNKQYDFALKLLNKAVSNRDHLANAWYLIEKIYQIQGNIPAMKFASDKRKK